MLTQRYEAMAWDVIPLLPEDYLRAVLRNEYSGAPNALHHISSMPIDKVIEAVESHASLDGNGRLWLNSTRTHSKTYKQIEDFHKNLNPEWADDLIAERFPA